MDCWGAGAYCLIFRWINMWSIIFSLIIWFECRRQQATAGWEWVKVIITRVQLVRRRSAESRRRDQCTQRNSVCKTLAGRQTNVIIHHMFHCSKTATAPTAKDEAKRKKMVGHKMDRGCGLSKWVFMHFCSVANDSHHHSYWNSYAFKLKSKSFKMNVKNQQHEKNKHMNLLEQ